jgi:hypothetical protein
MCWVVSCFDNFCRDLDWNLQTSEHISARKGAAIYVSSCLHLIPQQLRFVFKLDGLFLAFKIRTSGLRRLAKWLLVGMSQGFHLPLVNLPHYHHFVYLRSVQDDERTELGSFEKRNGITGVTLSLRTVCPFGLASMLYHRYFLRQKLFTACHSAIQL